MSIVSVPFHSSLHVNIILKSEQSVLRLKVLELDGIEIDTWIAGVQGYGGILNGRSEL